MDVRKRCQTYFDTSMGDVDGQNVNSSGANEYQTSSKIICGSIKSASSSTTC